jgi:predicted DCC family thiol-disulfide oxidoreductase YuxK
MRELTVLYDARCQLCRGARLWLSGQPQLVPLRFIAAGSEAARQRLPQLDHARSLEDITVVGDDGSVYRGAKAWIMCLWALRDHREQAQSLASPAMMPVARRFVAWVSRHRRELGTAGRALARA